MAGDADLVKAGVDAALAPLKDFANRLFGPAIDELGGILADPIKIYRFKRSVRLLEKVKRVCDENGFEPKAVPLKTLLPILENASLEDDEDLHDRWANLLANALSLGGHLKTGHRWPLQNRPKGPTQNRLSYTLAGAILQLFLRVFRSREFSVKIHEVGVRGSDPHLPQHSHHLTAVQSRVIDYVQDDLPRRGAGHLAVQYRLILHHAIDLGIARALCPSYPFVLEFWPHYLQHLARLTRFLDRLPDACEPEPIGPKNVRERAKQTAVRYAEGFLKIRIGDGANRLDQLARGPSGVVQV
jgi:hypothetical protein